jgi:plasmid maintenance system antidote protein VapI
MAKQMTPERLQECLTAIGWTVRGLAAHLGLHETRSRRWVGGQYPVPPEVAAWLERLATAHERNPPPEVQ